MHALRNAPVSALLLALLSSVPPLAAQCDPAWAVGDPPVAMIGAASAMANWDPDGAGPLPAMLVCAGDTGGFSTTTARVRSFDGVRWQPMGELASGSARSVVVYNGQLHVATTDALLVWTGSDWQQIAAVADIRAMVVWNGELFVTGSFTTAGGVAANRIARWNGSIWSPLGSGLGGTGRALAVFQNVLYVGGSFTSAGGLTASHLAIWNGANWAATAGPDGPVYALAARIGTALTNSFLFAGGAFTSLVVPANRVARFSPATNSWSALGSGLPIDCAALSVRATGLNSYELVAAAEDTSSSSVLRWDGPTSTWIALGVPSSVSELTCLAVFGGELVLGGFTTGMNCVHRYRAGAWQALTGEGIDGTVRAVLADGDETILGGEFRTISGAVVDHLVRGTPGHWTPLGGGVTGAGVFSTGVLALARLPNGDLVVGGSFTAAGGQPANNIARWNGTTWSALGTGTSGPITSIAVMPNGDLVVGGEFQFAGGGLVNNVARWNGSAWLPLGAGFNSVVRTLLVHSTGDLFAGGSFTNHGQKIVRWNGLNWFPLGIGIAADVVSLAELPGGDVAAGWFAGAGGVSRWNGTAWSAAGTFVGGAAEPLALAVLPDGDVVAAGRYGLHRLHAGVWTPVGVASNLRALDQGPDQVWRVGGSFDQIDGVAAARFALRELPCPASASTFANGCASSGGPNTLTVTAQPWANGVFRAEVTGMPAPSWALAVWGLSPVAPSLPLDAVFAEALPGCHLHVTPDGIDSVPAPAGVATTQLMLPNIPPVVGVTLYHQAVVIVLDAQLQLLEVSSSNAVQATIGIF